MENLNCVIIEDDLMQLELLKGLLSEVQDISITFTYGSSTEALAQLEKWKGCDLLFLDVELPKMSGLELIDKIPSEIPVVLVTSKSEYAVEAFEKRVEDYILKPVKYAKLLDVIDGYRMRRKEQSKSDSKTIYIKCHNTYEKITLEDIQVIRGADDYVEIYTNERKLLAKSSMGKILEKLPSSQFMRVHRSSIINLEKIEKIDGHSLVIGNHNVIVSKTYLSPLLEKLNVL